MPAETSSHKDPTGSVSSCRHMRNGCGASLVGRAVAQPCDDHLYFPELGRAGRVAGGRGDARRDVLVEGEDVVGVVFVLERYTAAIPGNWGVAARCPRWSTPNCIS